MAAASVAGCAPDPERRDESSPPPPTPLPPTPLRAAAEAVLPGELGHDGTERAVAAFERWAAGIEPVAELGHPYLVPETRYSGPDPRPGWAAQLDALDREAGHRHGAAFADLGIAARRALLARPLAQAGPGPGSPLNAQHIAAALLAHFYASPVATDLCFGRTIAKQQCRGLDGAPDEPAPRAARNPALVTTTRRAQPPRRTGSATSFASAAP